MSTAEGDFYVQFVVLHAKRGSERMLALVLDKDTTVRVAGQQSHLGTKRPKREDYLNARLNLVELEKAANYLRRANLKQFQPRRKRV